ncbi:MAG: hypothetical protein ACK4I0_06730 [Brevundimonas sp.]|uniref:hypothetical protein n=1 Tax=Brevundimonas sp. TaxID=1871086 RepID=UPI003918B767
MTDNWLSEIVVVNESPDETVAGDVSIFRHAGDACAHLEYWWVEDKEGFAMTAAGHRVELGVGAKRDVIIVGMEEVPTGTEVVRSWLHSVATHVLEKRSHKAKRGKLRLSPSEAQGHLPASSEALIAYIFMK